MKPRLAQHIDARARMPADDVSALLDDPAKQLKSAAFHQYPACGMPSINHTRGGCNNVPRSKFDFMGYSIRTVDWRYTLWLPWNQANLTASWDGPISEEELYSHSSDDSTDMDRWENRNVARSRSEVATALRAQLQAFFLSTSSQALEVF
jgi:hypothetical protein